MILTFTDSLVVEKENTNYVFVLFDLFLFDYYVNVFDFTTKGEKHLIRVIWIQTHHNCIGLFC